MTPTYQTKKKFATFYMTAMVSFQSAVQQQIVQTKLGILLWMVKYQNLLNLKENFYHMTHPLIPLL